MENVLPSDSATPTQEAIPLGMGEEARAISKEFANASDHFTEPVSHTQLPRKFDILAATWEWNNSLISSVEQLILLPEYQEIIGMGKDAVPLILQKLRAQPSYWFWALKAITGENPIKPEDRGNLSKMTEAWLTWGAEHGYL
ncbi:MAG: hypothetical protein AABZ06_05885 [Bdellovibrionota bacterium]